jgi:hypothetical protein
VAAAFGSGREIAAREEEPVSAPKFYDAAIAAAERAVAEMIARAEGGEHGLAYVTCPACGASVDLADDHGDCAPGERPRLHVLEDCWCGWHHEMKWASEFGWDTSGIGDRLLMTTDEPAGE